MDEIDYVARHVQNVGIQRLSLVFEYNSQGWELRDQLIDSLEAIGKRVASISSIDHEGSKYSLPGAVLSVMAGKRQAIVFGSDYVASGKFIEAVRKAGFSGLFYTRSTVGAGPLMAQLGSLATGMSVAQVVPFPWTRSTPVGRAFAAFCAQAAVAPTFASMEAWLMANASVEALRRTRDFSPAGIAQAVDTLPARDLGGFVSAFCTDSKVRRKPASVDLTVFASTGKFVR